MPNQHVVPSQGQWAIRPAGGARVTARFRTQRAAIQRARRIARRQRCELLVHGRDGRIRARDTFGHDPVVTKG